jgi:hypothetical protein
MKLSRWIVWLACALIVAMYACNQDMGGDPSSPRGDGRYRPVLARGDGHMMYLMARSTALDLDWDFGNDLARFGDPWNEPVSRETHRKEIVHPVGPALVWTPLIWIATAGAAIANVFGADIPLHGYTLWTQRFVFLSSALLGCLAVMLAWRLARSLVGGTWAASYAAVAVLLGTSLTYYATFMPSYSHAMDAEACAAFLAYWATTYGRTDYKRFAILGALLGVATLIRVQELPFGIVIVVEAIATRSVRVVIGGAIALAITVVLFIPQFIEWHVVFGTVTRLPQGPRYTRFNAPMIPELLWSPRNGWFVTTPIAYLACIGLAFIPRKQRPIAIGLALVVLIQIYLNSTILDWWGGASYGQRRLCNVTLPLVIGLAALLAAAGRLARRLPRVANHTIAVVVLGTLIAWNVARVYRLHGGKPAPSEMSASCCNSVPGWARGPVSWWYRHLGNPFELPASLAFGVRHDVAITRWDQIVGEFALVPAFGDVRKDDLSRVHATFGLADRFLLAGWSGVQGDRARRYRTVDASAATVLVPNLMPDPVRVTVWLSAPEPTVVTLEWNGDVVGVALATPAWSPAAFVFHGDLHMNELTVLGRGARVADLDLQLVR